MFRSVIWFAAASSLTLLVGPLAFVASQAGKTDPADLYIIIEAGAPTLSESQLASFGAKEVGPLRGVITKIIHAPPVARQRIMQVGHTMLPASALAELCRIGANQNSQKPRSS